MTNNSSTPSVALDDSQLDKVAGGSGFFETLGQTAGGLLGAALLTAIGGPVVSTRALAHVTASGQALTLNNVLHSVFGR